MDPDYAAGYGRLYREHWWWRAREAIVVDTLRALPLPHEAAILDVGCGDALAFPALSAFGKVRGIEVVEVLLSPAGPYRGRIATRPLGVPLYSSPAWRFDLITALDVIEHIDDDRAVVASMVAMLRPGGYLVVTVPAFALLWSHHDEVNHHRRRYTTVGLRRLLDDAGLEVLRVRYVFRGLFGPKLAIRALNTGWARKVAGHGLPPSPINAALRRACLWEDRLLRRLPVPFGTSVLAVARRPRGA